MSETDQPDVYQRNGVTVISFGNAYSEIDETRIEQLRAILPEIARTADPPQVVVDLPHTNFFSSSFIGLLLTMSRQLEKRGGSFGLSSLTPYCKELIEMTRMDVLWAVCDTLDEAIQHLQGD